MMRKCHSAVFFDAAYDAYVSDDFGFFVIFRTSSRVVEKYQIPDLRIIKRDQIFTLVKLKHRFAF